MTESSVHHERRRSSFLSTGINEIGREIANSLLPSETPAASIDNLQSCGVCEIKPLRRNSAHRGDPGIPFILAKTFHLTSGQVGRAR